MKSKNLFAKIPYEFATEDHVWIEIAPHIHNNKVVGFYLNTYKEIDLDSTSDTWFEKLDHAKQAAREDFGISETEWLIKSG